MDKLSVGRFIAEQRKAKQLTQKQLAEKLNVTDKAVSKWETGKCYPDVEMLECLSGFLGVTVNDILSGRVLGETSFAEEADKNIVQAMKDTKKTKSVFKKIIISLVLCPVVIYVILTILRLIVSFPLWFAETAEVDGWEITYNKLLNSAFVDCYFADPDEEDFEITVPDEYNGMPVTKFGHSSLVPVMPFNIDLSELYMNAPESSIYDSYFTKDIIVSHTDGEFFCIENVVFKLYIGKNIKEIKDVDMDYYYPHINEDGSITFYHPVVEIYCSEENKHFYSEDGRLYKRSNGELITDFSYAE